MKIQVRKSVFETNSSTCHTIAIPKRETPEYEDKVSIYEIERWFNKPYHYNRGMLEMVETVRDKIAFAFMLILYRFSYRMRTKKYGGEGKTHEDLKPEIDIWRSKILDWLEEEASEEDKGKILDYVRKLMDFLEEYILTGESEITRFGDSAWIDHPEEMDGFVDSIERDPELLRKFIFDPEAYATVCGDEYRGTYVKQVGFEDDYPRKYDKSNTEETFKDRVRKLRDKWDFWMTEDLE